MRLDRLLIAHELITPEQAASAEAHMLEHNCRFGEALVALGIMTEHHVSVFLGAQQLTRATSIFAKSRAVLQMLRATAQSVAAR